MGIITVNGPQTGTPYSVKISGDQPTPAEQERINKYVADQEQYTQSVVQGYRGTPTVQQSAPEAVPEPEPEDTTAIGRGFRRGVESVQSLFGTSVEELGRGTGIAGLESYGRGLEESAQAELERLAKTEGATTRQDVEGVGTGLSYVGEVAGEQAPILGATLSGTAAGALAGSFFPIVGTGVGAVIGGAAASFPLLFGGNVQRQEEQVAAGELENVDISKALVAAGGQAAIEGIAGRILAFMPFKPGVGNLFSRTVKTGAAGAATEVPTEITQQIIERAQAGLPIDSDDAIQEYIDAGVAAGILGGGLGAGAGAFRPNLAEQELALAEQELDQDMDEFETSNAGRLANIDKHIDEDERDTGEILALPAPESGPVLEALPAPQPEAIFEGKDFGRNEYNTVLQQVQEDGELNMPKAQSMLKQMTGAPVSMQRVRSIAETLAQQGEIDKSTRAKKDKFTITPSSKAASDAIDALRRDTDVVLNKIRKISAELPRLDLDSRYAEQTGRDTYGKQRKAAEVQRVIQSKIAQLNKLNERLEVNKQNLRTANVDYSVPVTEKVGMPASQVRMQDLIEQHRIEQEAELQKVRAAANARAVADAVRGNRDNNISVTTREYTKRQAQILESLRQRLNKVGLKNVQLEGRKIIRSAREGFSEGVSYANPQGEQVIGLSMGLYDPTLSDADYESRVAEVMDHEIIHALRNLNVFTPKELQLLSKAARKTNYVKADGGKNIKRNYSYFDRAARINPELSVKKDKQGVLSSLEEEAIAEMYRDYVGGRLTKVGQSRSVLKRIGDFFKSIVGAHVDNGFNSVDSIFGNITGGSVAGRQQLARQAQEALNTAPEATDVTPAPVQSEQAIAQAGMPQAKQSRIPVTEEEYRTLQDIRMPIDPNLPYDQVRAQIQKMTTQNMPMVRRLITAVDQEFGTKSGDNVKDLSKVTQKAQRPSILASKPWHNVSHIRDSYRFKTVIDDFRKVPGIFNKLLDAGISLVKIDTGKLFQPKEWGWRIIAFDLRMPNGQLVEWYLPLKELEIEKKQRGHLIFEEWRNKTAEELSAQREEYFESIARSYRGYDNAFKAALERMGLTPQEAEASWRSAESSISEAARNARKSSGVGISSGVRAETDLTTPSAVRTALEPSDMNMTAREVPSSTRANASSDIGVTPSDIDVTGIPLEQQPSFARLRRSAAVPALSDFIRSNPDGFHNQLGDI
jgi:predicted transcriptional regulator